jgi:hypothetical protein
MHELYWDTIIVDENDLILTMKRLPSLPRIGEEIRIHFSESCCLGKIIAVRYSVGNKPDNSLIARLKVQLMKSNSSGPASGS